MAEQREFLRRTWALIPGPPIVSEVLDSQSFQGEIAAYSPEEIARAILSVPEVRLVGDAADWWKWRAEVVHGADLFELTMSLFERDSEPPLWGGSNVIACSEPAALLSFWKQLRRTYPRIWLHSSECEIYNPTDFQREYVLQPR